MTKLRPIQLVCLALLLSTLRFSDPSVLTPANFAIESSYLRALLSQECGEGWNGLTETDHTGTRTRTGTIPAVEIAGRTQVARLAPESASAARTAWTMRPPSAQCAALQTVTGFGRPIAA